MYYYNLMGPPSYMRSIFDRNVVMRHLTVHTMQDYTEGRGFGGAVRAGYCHHTWNRLLTRDQ
jgi:hypothetical protein